MFNIQVVVDNIFVCYTYRVPKIFHKQKPGRHPRKGDEGRKNGPRRGNANRIVQCQPYHCLSVCVFSEGPHNSESLKGQNDQHEFAMGCNIYFIFCSLKDILEQQLILYPKTGCCNIFCNCEHSRVLNALRRPAAVEAVACRGLMMPRTTVGRHAHYKIVVLSSGVW